MEFGTLQRHTRHQVEGAALLSALPDGEGGRNKRRNIMKKIAIITGASRGIGRAVAKRLAQDGFAVVVNYLSNASEAEEVVAEIKVIGGEAIAIKADVANQTDVERLFEETMKKFGSVDVVVHNSGIMPLSPIGKSDVELLDKVISTNLRAEFLVFAQAART